MKIFILCVAFMFSWSSLGAESDTSNEDFDHAKEDDEELLEEINRTRLVYHRVNLRKIGPVLPVIKDFGLDVIRRAKVDLEPICQLIDFRYVKGYTSEIDGHGEGGLQKDSLSKILGPRQFQGAIALCESGERLHLLSPGSDIDNQVGETRMLSGCLEIQRSVGDAGLNQRLLTASNYREVSSDPRRLLRTSTTDIITTACSASSRIMTTEDKTEKTLSKLFGDFKKLTTKQSALKRQ